jgi:hypothetical protein
MIRIVALCLLVLVACAPAYVPEKSTFDLTWEANAADFGRVALEVVKSLDVRYQSAFISRISDSAFLETFEIQSVNLARDQLEVIYLVKSDRLVDLYVSDQANIERPNWRPNAVELETKMTTTLDASFKRAPPQ